MAEDFVMLQVNWAASHCQSEPDKYLFSTSLGAGNQFADQETMVGKGQKQEVTTQGWKSALEIINP